MPKAAIASSTPDVVAPVATLTEELCAWVDRLTRRPSNFTCPDCGGSLWEDRTGNGKDRFRCRVGHTFDIDELLSGKSHAFQEAIWAAIVALEERRDLMVSMENRYTARGDKSRAVHYRLAAQAASDKAKLLNRMIDELGGESEASDEIDDGVDASD